MRDTANRDRSYFWSDDEVCLLVEVTVEQSARYQLGKCEQRYHLGKCEQSILAIQPDDCWYSIICTV